MQDNGRRDSLGDMRNTIATLGLVVLLAGCGNGTGASEPETSESLPSVSTATSCGQLFDGDAPIEKVVDLMTAEAAASDDETATALADELAPIEAQAGEEIQPHVEVVENELRAYAEVQAGESFDTGTMVTSLTELNNVCGVTPRF